MIAFGGLRWHEKAIADPSGWKSRKKDFVMFVARRSEHEKRQLPTFAIVSDEIQNKKSEAEDDPHETQTWCE